MFGILKARRQEPEGRPISRIAKQLNAPGSVIESEMGVWVGTPEGVWGWLSMKGIEVKKFRLCSNK